MHIVICDDSLEDALAAETYVTTYFLSHHFSDFTITIVRSGFELLLLQEMDLLFLDIELNSSQKGTDYAKELYLRMPALILIFMSAHNHFIPRSVAVGFDQFIPKPFQQQFFQIALDDIFGRQSSIISPKPLRRSSKEASEKPQVLSPVLKRKNIKGALLHIAISEIVFLSVIEKQLTVVQSDHSQVFYLGNMTKEESGLAPYGFFRIHRRYLINIHYLHKVSLAGAEMHFPDGSEKILPIGRTKLSAIREALSLKKSEK